MVDDAPAPMTKVGRLAESRLEQKEDYGRDASRRPRWRGAPSAGGLISLARASMVTRGEPVDESGLALYLSGSLVAIMPAGVGPDKRTSRRKALVAFGKAAAGVAAVTVAAAIGLGYDAQSTASSASQSVEPGFTPLFDGATLDGWKQAGPGGFTVVDGTLQSFGGMGLLWYTKKQFSDFVLKCDWKEVHFGDNSGVFVRFPDPGNDPWVAVNNGYEVQIDNVGAPDGDPIDKTGAIFSFQAPSRVASNPVGEWNFYEIQAVGQDYTVILNGEKVTNFFGSRGTTGYVGLQNHDDTSTVTFRDVRIMEL